jgi:serine phosphatase RsbU (regulator of sigma subunit)
MGQDACEAVDRSLLAYWKEGAVVVSPGQHEEVQRLHCEEIWGGVRAVDAGVSVPGIDARVINRPYRDEEGGGDIYYVGLCGQGALSRFIVADVSGHGTIVSDLAARLRRLMAQYMNTPDQSRLVRSLNDEFASLAEEGRFATALIMSYLPASDHLVTVNAGHPPPLWYSRADDAWRPLRQDAPRTARFLFNLPLGVIPQTPYHQFAVRLSRGDVVVLYTDSLSEATDATNRQVGEEGLLRLLESLGPGDPAGLGKALVGAVVDHHGGRPLNDDVTVLTLHHNAQDPAPLSGDLRR